MIKSVLKVGVATGASALAAAVLGGPVGIAAAGALIVFSAKEIRDTKNKDN